MLFFYKESVPAGQSATSFAYYIGGNNADVPALITNPAMNVAVVGATSTAIVTLQVAVIPTDANQSTPPVDADYFNMTQSDGTAITYTKNTIQSFNSLNGLWVRFHIDNTGSSSTATITAQIS